MRVVMLVPMSGPDIDLGVGDILDCDDTEGQRLIAAEVARDEAEPAPVTVVKHNSAPAPVADPAAKVKGAAKPVSDSAEKA